MFTLIFIMHLINQKLNLRVINVLIKIIGTMVGVLLGVGILCFFLYLFIELFIFIFSLLKLLLAYIIPEKVGIYLSFVITFIVYGYFPDKVGYYFLKLVEKIEGGNRNGFSEGYRSLIRFLRPKLWLYFIAFVLTIVASVEKIIDLSLINYSIWIENKDYLFEAVVTFLAFDSFISLLESEYKKISSEVLSITKYIKDVFDDIKLND